MKLNKIMLIIVIITILMGTIFLPKVQADNVVENEIVDDEGTEQEPPAEDGGTEQEPPATDGGTEQEPPATDGGTGQEPPAEDDDKGQTQITWTDVSNARVYIDKKIEGYFAEYTLKIEGINTLKDHSYRYFITYNDEIPDLELTSSNTVGGGDPYPPVMEINANKYIEKNGDIYFWLVEQQHTNSGYQYKYIIEKRKLERPALEKIGLRIGGFFFEEHSSIFMYDITNNSSSNARNVSIKIGKITDNNILRAIKNGEANCLSKLLTYAKSEQAIYTTSMHTNSNNESIVDKFNLVDGEYYFVYMVADDEKGKYYPIEDVSLYQGRINENGKSLLNYLDKTFVWNLGEETEGDGKDDTVAPGKLPQTGVSYLVVIVMTVFAGIAAFAYRKVRMNRDIK